MFGLSRFIVIVVACTIKSLAFPLLQHLEKSSEKTEETERLKQLVSENMSLKQRTSELQNHLQRLLAKLKNEKQKVRP